MAVEGKFCRDRPALFRPHGSDQPDGSHADCLFCYLRQSGNFCFLHSIVIAVDTGMKGAERDGQCDHRQIRGAPGFQQDIAGQGLAQSGDSPGQDEGEAHGERKGSQKGFLSLGLAGCHILAESCLKGTGAERKADTEKGMDHLIDS